MCDQRLQHRFDVLCQITRAQHFAWRAAVAERLPAEEVPRVVDRMWEITGDQTGASYAKRIDPNAPVAPQVAASLVWSSDCMGEEAAVTTDADGRVYVVHSDCPWFHWHRRLGLSAEDRPGCDAWFRNTLAAINRTLGCDVRFETLEALPEGGTCCRRRLWDG